MKKLNIKRAQLLLFALALASSGVLYVGQQVSAASLSNTYIRTNRMTAGATSSWRLVFKTASAGATSVVVDFNGADTTTWSGSSGSVFTGANTTSVSTCPSEATATALPGTLVATGSASHTLTITGVTALSASTTYCVDITSSNALTIPTAGEYHPTITAGSDSTTVAVRSVSNDQIVVSATVPPTFNMSLSGNTDSFTSSLVTNAVNITSGRDITVNTNAKNGWFIWASDSSTGLSSAATAHTIPSATPLGSQATIPSNGSSEAYGLGVVQVTQGSGGGSASASAAFSSNGTTQASGLDSSLRLLASSNGTASGAAIKVKEFASITPLTQAANDYTDTITFVGAGNF